MTSWILYSIVVELGGVCLFLYGFFLVNYDGHISDINFDLELQNSSRTESHIRRTVLMVIDGMRYNFLGDNRSLSSMPFLQESLLTGQAALFPCKVNVPTVTMPRIKAITGGRVSSFLDIARNFGTKRMMEDNIIFHLRKSKRKMVFYGDDTWIKLFPGMFDRYEGTNSFFVRDFYEVDYNVTRNVNRELQNYDWDVMILHYLGLDHIGHVEGPKSSRIPLKLTEMDEVARSIHDYLKESGMSYLLIVCSDHGMRDSGGHGGSSLPEILVPVVTLGLNFHKIEDEISQIDIAVTLASLLNLPIPLDSIGNLMHEILQEFDSKTKASMLRRNTEHLLNKYHSIIGESKNGFVVKNFIKAEKLLSSNIETSISIYIDLSKHLSLSLLSSLSKFDLYFLCIGILLTCQACILPLLRNICQKLGFTFIRSCIISLGFVAVVNFSFLNTTLNGIILSYIVFIVINFNFHIFILGWKTMVQTVWLSALNLKADPCLAFIIFGLCLRILSTVSTSLIEEEHMIWYFFWTTFVAVSLFRTSTKHQIYWVISILVANRFLQSLNQTGDKYSSLSDVGDWFTLSENKLRLSAFLIFELFSLSCTYRYLLDFNRYGYEKNKNVKVLRILKNLASMFFHVALIFVYFYRVAVDEVSLPFHLTLSTGGMTEFRIFMYMVAASLLFELLAVSASNQYYSFILIFMKVWILVVAIITRPYNIILLPLLVIVSHWVHHIMSPDLQNKIITTILLHHWLARVYFFLQGNSNSLATIDVAAGYTGQARYNEIVVGILILINLYATPILAYALMFQKLALNSNEMKKTEIKTAARVFLIFENANIAFYLIIVAIQRHHLFVWSVFSPKLLYDSAYSVIFFTVTLLLIHVSA